MSDRERRIARNEILFREINERLKEMQETFDVLEDTSEFVCECGNVECTDRIELSLPEYEALRGDPTTFAVVSGHQVEDVEVVVETHERYLVVRKRQGEAAEMARAGDPRS
jgi:hypothetical protein